MCLLAGLAWVAPAGANPDTPEKEYLLTQPGTGRPTGARLQLDPVLALPVGTDGIFTGGQMATTGPPFTGSAGTPSTGPGIWPQLLIGPAPSAVTTGFPTAGRRIRQAATTPQGGAIQVPASVLTFTALGFPNHGGVYDPALTVYDIATTLSYQWPATAVTLSPGGGPAPAFPGVFTAMGPGDSTITYRRTSAAGKSFGGPALFALQPGPSAGTRLVPANAMGMLPVATLFVNVQNVTPPTMANFVGLVAVSTGGGGRAAPGGGMVMTSFGPVSNGLRTVNAGVPSCTMWCLGSNGTVMGLPNDTTVTTWSIGPGAGAGSVPANDLITSQGFPWTTGFITVYAPYAFGAVTFFLKGSDGRGTGASQGAGNLSLVSGALSQRTSYGASTSRAWLSLNLPEPGAALGAAAALGMLALCHALVRRGSR